jgi:creatinine amidohydrolase
MHERLASGPVNGEVRHDLPSVQDARDLELATDSACSHEHASWPGTVSTSAATLHAVIGDVTTSLKASGVHRLLIVNGHGGNYVLSNIVQEASVAGPGLALFPARDGWRAAREASGCQTDNSADMHAGELETSILLRTAPGDGPER